MTRPASFNNTWAENVDPGQYADESTDTTIGFMKTGWEGGSDKKAPSAKTQNYHMRKHDLAMQESERQGMLSWRSDVPYPAGARTWWHGNVFIAISDNQGVEPQGGNDNGIWFLSPVKNYPATWSNISEKPETAIRWPDYSEVKNTPLLGGSAYLNVDNGHWQAISKGSEALLPAGTFASMRDALGTAAYHDIDPGDWSVVGNDKLAVASVAHIYGARNYFESTKVSRDNCIAAGFLGGDYQLPHIRAADGNSIILARKDNFDSSIQAINNGKVDRDNITTAGFSGGDVSKPYFKSGGGTDVVLARREYVDALNTNMDNAKITRDNVTIAGFTNGSKFDPYFRHSSGEAVPLTRLAYVEEIKKALTDGKVDRDNITTAGFLNGIVSSPYMSGPAGRTLLQERATSGSTETNGTITFPNVITMQYGSYNYPDITTAGTFTIPFNEPWTRIMCVLITVDSGQDVTAVTLNVTSSNFQVRIREWYNATSGGTIRWFALGFK